ncbi:MAG TPA: methylated-DNA--[protein]-cysteine S-methyltransferase [Anaeromyxobacteraceae bacterium]|nr:methylated-DNA--[protein]-cysteine S-methyltransferase [Anaeromyxobacteraceae bacterium]
MIRYTRKLDTPIGRLEVIASARGIEEVRFGGTRGGEAAGDHPLLAQAERELAEYFEGRRQTFALPIALSGTAFEQEVYRELLAVPFGETRSYSGLAARLGRPRAARAVGSANARNPLALLVPCHRVIGADGSLTGYAGGEDAKRWLLLHERRLAGRPRGLPTAAAGRAPPEPPGNTPDFGGESHGPTKPKALRFQG